ncbi:MAG TPA: DUF1549 and DUF1553 domain-containing protein [Bryobacteraceae bacterium]|nr:DUF1549 and DUF1553 domain-containing protein [Bryobacteraceae bacterium]
MLIASGAVAPLGKYTPVERRHWAFVPRARPEVPKFSDPAGRAWVRNPVDAFILARLRKENLAPSPEADRATLIRRLSFDLTGLPPTPAEVAAFTAAKSPDAYSKLVEKLLDSPHYGERWGQHWLDVVRFAETDGFEYDTHRRDAWRYRDYVIRAFQNDKPYDRFLTEQLAGDEIGPKEDETLIAAGFNRLGPLRKNAGNQEVASSRNEVLTEMTNVIGSALLGVTLGCARCHDHKFDPIRQSDYYRIQAYFAAAQQNDVSRATPEEVAAWKAKTEPIEAELKKLKASMRGKTPDEKEAISKRMEELQEKMPEPLPAVYSMSDDMANKSPIHLLARGDYQNKGDSVGMRPLGVLLPDGAPELPPDVKQPRAELAGWITDPDNPLTARVMVNRIWHYHFGRGIVATPNDFGRMGVRPSHPELLDYLANEFVAGGFSVKKIHRLIVNSSAYRQSSSSANTAAAEKDPENRLLWKFTRRRLEAEEIRDAMLAVSGRLNPKEGGPSVIVPIDKSLVGALYKPSQWAVTPDPKEHDRRSVYLIAKRNLRLPFMEVFDAPDTLVSCPRRESSTHAPQALELLNGVLANQQAEALAARLAAEAGPDPRKQVDLAYRLLAGRPPGPKELQQSVAFLKTQSLREFALAMLNLNAFLYVN